MLCRRGVPLVKKERERVQGIPPRPARSTLLPAEMRSAVIAQKTNTYLGTGISQSAGRGELARRSPPLPRALCPGGRPYAVLCHLTDCPLPPARTTIGEPRRSFHLFLILSSGAPHVVGLGKSCIDGYQQVPPTPSPHGHRSCHRLGFLVSPDSPGAPAPGHASYCCEASFSVLWGRTHSFPLSPADQRASRTACSHTAPADAWCMAREG